MELIAIPAFEDNYIWMIQHGQEALVVDPGEAAPVMEALRSRSVSLTAILVTHHHVDHVGGVNELLSHFQAHVWAPGLDQYDFPHTELWGGEHFELWGCRFEVMACPGHTAGHIAYHCHPEQQAPILFCGDTLFSAGCGRLFEGTPEQMTHSLDAFAQLPNDARVCCAHEYTLSNLRFAQAVEPHNEAIAAHLQHCQQLRQQGLATLPSSLEVEQRINPFLRVREPEVIQAAQRHQPHASHPAEVLAVLREWKNRFK